MKICTRWGNAACRHWHDDRGSATIEFVIWVPVFFSIILLTADTSLIFMRQSNFYTVSNETARIVARHGMDEETAKAFAEVQAAIGSYVPEVDVAIYDEIVRVTIKGNPAVMAPFGVLRLALGDQISVQVTHALEPI